MVGAAEEYRPAEGCPVASEKFGNGAYMAHQGDSGSFLVAQARVRDGSAAVRLSVWSCVFCHVTLVGLGDPDEPVGQQDFTWFERAGEG